MLPVTNHPLGIKGLFEFQIQLHENITVDKEKEVLKELIEIFKKNRSLSTDLDQIVFLKKEEISFSGKISIDSFMVGEDILANIYHDIKNYLNYRQLNNAQINLSDEELVKDLYMGPKIKNYGLKQYKLQDKINEIYRSEIIEIIENVPGVIAQVDFIIYKNGVRCFDDIITFSKNRYPVLSQIEQDINSSNYVIELYRNNYKYEIDTTIFNQLFEALSMQQTATYNKLREVFKDIPKGNFSRKDIETYYSIQNELPAVYGLKENELPTNSTKKRVAQSRQLKAYLLLFEQVMANYLSQLTNIRELYSVDERHLDTYFNQIPHDIAHLKEIIAFDDLKNYKKYLNSINGSNYKNLERKHQFIDHLIARYGEYYDTSTINKLNRINTGEVDLLCSLKAKMRYARSLIDLGYKRNKGQIYKSGKNKILLFLLLKMF